MLDTWAERHLLHPVLFFPGPQEDWKFNACQSVLGYRVSLRTAWVVYWDLTLKLEGKDGAEGAAQVPGTRLSLQHHSDNQYPKTGKPFLCLVYYSIYSAWDISCLVPDAQPIPLQQPRPLRKMLCAAEGSQPSFHACTDFPLTARISHGSVSPL